MFFFIPYIPLHGLRVLLLAAMLNNKCGMGRKLYDKMFEIEDNWFNAIIMKVKTRAREVIQEMKKLE